MPKFILKIPYMKATPKSGRWVRYIATREGVDKNINQQVVIKKPTKRQMEYIDEMLKVCPDSKDTYEYQDYIDNPTRQNASALISVIAESNPEIFEDRETYVDYIATRPNVEKHGEHGLFGNEDNIELGKVRKQISEHKGLIWMPIMSLKREDATRLGYDSAEMWRDMLRAKQAEIAEVFGIPLEDFRWYAAFHNEGHHPHCHMVIYCENNKRGYINNNDIRKMKSIVAREIFKNDMYELYDEKTKQREKISDESRSQLKELVNRIQEKDYSDSPICEMLLDLSRKLKKVNGKKLYGYLPKPLKKDVDEIVKTMAQEADIQNLYNAWCNIQKKIVELYNDQEVEHPPLWENKEFKKIKNAVISEAVKLSDDRILLPQQIEDLPEIKDENEPANNIITLESTEDESDTQHDSQTYIEPQLGLSALNLFCRLATIIDNDAEHKIDGHNKTIVDSKEWKELARKKQKLGIKMH